MFPPSPPAPDDSTCWQWWTPPPEGKMPEDAPPPPTGCDYAPCEKAVCDCDPYCCDSAWDLSCRGYELAPGDDVENNYFVDGCSAKILCCEQESAYPDPPVGGATPPKVTQPDINTSNQCDPATDGPTCCATMIPPSYLAPNGSTCWQWFTPPAGGKMPANAPPPPTGCDYSPCKAAVCECDKYCCDTAWDLSCRGYELAPGDTVENNYFVDGCSAKILCCEQEDAYPDPPIAGAEPDDKPETPYPVPPYTPYPQTTPYPMYAQDSSGCSSSSKKSKGGKSSKSGAGCSKSSKSKKGKSGKGSSSSSSRIYRGGYRGIPMTSPYP